jgi:hypothetical protein
MGFFESAKTPQKADDNIIEKMKENKYYMFCIQKCSKNFLDYLDEEEKICLAKCNDNIQIFLKENYDLLFQVKSKI